MSISDIAPTADYGPLNGVRGKNHAAQSGMGMNNAVCNDDGKVQLPFGWSAQ
jgi:hypothetical protein